MRIQLELSVSSASKAAQKVRFYSTRLGSKVLLLCNLLAEVGATAAIQTVRVSDTDTAASIHVEKDGQAGYLVIADGEHAAFAEFGTGVVGEGTYEGELPAEWGYDLRWTPEAHDEADPTKWYFYNEEGRRRSTRGRTADGFMFAGSQVMRDMVVPLAKDVFGR